MKYDRLDEAGTIHIHYEGPSLDALALGILEVQLHRIAEKVAVATLVSDRRSVFDLLQHPSFLPPGAWRQLRKRWPKSFDPMLYYDFVPQSLVDIEGYASDSPVVRLRSESIRSGSLYQDLAVYLASALSNSDVRAVLQGFGGNLLYAIINSGLRGIEWVGERIQLPSGERKTQSVPVVFDPFDVGPNLREIAKELIANSNGEASTLKITHKVRDGQKEIVIQLK